MDGVTIKEDWDEKYLPLHQMSNSNPLRRLSPPQATTPQIQITNQAAIAMDEQILAANGSPQNSNTILQSSGIEYIESLLPRLQSIHGCPPSAEDEKWLEEGSHQTSAEVIEVLKDNLTSLHYIPTDATTKGNSKRAHALNKSQTNDPLSHRIIEKRRRDRMNNCLADLSRLIPSYYLKKGRGRIEKTEIIEMAIKYLQHLQAHACNDIETCAVTTKQENVSTALEHFQMGYNESMSETLAFLRDSEGLFSGDSLCVRILNHLTKHCENVLKNENNMNQKGNPRHSSSSSSSGYHANGSSNGSSSDGNGSGSNPSPDNKEALPIEDSAYRSSTDPIRTDTTLESSSFVSSSEHSESSSPPNGSKSNQVLPYPSLELSHSSTAYTSSSSSSPGSNNSSSGDDNNNNTGVRQYKFKSNLKHRFSVDSEHSQGKKKRHDSDSSCGFTDPEKDASSGRRNLHQTNPYNRPCSRASYQQHFSAGHEDRLAPSSGRIPFAVPATISSKKDTLDGVPVFALNAAGTFYIPLTVDYSVVALALAQQQGITPVLHPISIYVNFSTPNKASFQQDSNSLMCPLRNIYPESKPIESFLTRLSNHGRDSLFPIEHLGRRGSLCGTMEDQGGRASQEGTMEHQDSNQDRQIKGNRRFSHSSTISQHHISYQIPHSPRIPLSS